MGTQQTSGQNPNLVNNIYTTLTETSDDIVGDNVAGVCIFKVPQSLSEAKPEAYVPQLLGLGPYNHFRPELRQMQTFKLAAVERVRREFRNGIAFDALVGALGVVGVPRGARACYASYLEMDDEALACLVAVDGLYLFELLRRCVIKGYDDRAGPGFFRDLVGFSEGTVCPRIITIRDTIMLENQIPILALRAIIAAEHCDKFRQSDKASSTVVTKLLPTLLLNFAANISPLKPLKDYPLHKVSQHSHLLDLLYSLLTLENSPEKSSDEEENDERLVSELGARVRTQIFGHADEHLPMARISSAPTNHDPGLIDEFVVHIAEEAMQYIPPGLNIPVRLIQGLVKLPWSKLWSFIKSSLKGQHKDEILIPRASELRKKGIKFCPVDRIHEIKFDRSALSLHLPSIKLDDCSEAVLRNLVAYEAATKTERDTLVLARYVELISALAQSGEDVKSLEGTITARAALREDEAVARLFGGMNKALRATNTPELDGVVADVNAYYDALWSVSLCRFVSKWGRIALSCFVVFALLSVCLAVLVSAFMLVYEWLLSTEISQAQFQGLTGINLRSDV